MLFLSQVLLEVCATQLSAVAGWVVYNRIGVVDLVQYVQVPLVDGLLPIELAIDLFSSDMGLFLHAGPLSLTGHLSLWMMLPQQIRSQLSRTCLLGTWMSKSKMKGQSLAKSLA